MAKFVLRLKKSAEKELQSLPIAAVIQINQSVLNLADDPFPHGYKKLKGLKNMYRIRSGDYRIIYTIHQQILIIEILKIGHRKDIYD